MLFLAVLGPPVPLRLFSWCSAGASHRCDIVEHRLEGVRASVVAAPGLWSPDSVVVSQGLSCSAARGTFLDQGSNLCLLHWPVAYLPLSPQGSPSFCLLNL